MKKLVIVTSLVVIIVLHLPAQNPGWIVPDDQKSRSAPVKFTPDMAKQGEAVYLKNCQSCHGLPGKRNFAAITPSPGDLSDSRAGSQTDGELFYRITSGKTPMPEFRNILSEDERWAVISFLRIFHKGYVQPEPLNSKGTPAKRIRLSLNWDPVKKKIGIRAVEPVRDGLQPVKGAQIIVTVQRYFGNFQFADPKPTSEAGYSSFDWPQDLPGDISGKVILRARVYDPSGVLPEAMICDTLSIGVPTDNPPVTDTRAWWTTRDKAPVWAILTYGLAVIIVWYFIFYIVLSVLNIRRIKPN